MINWDKVKRGTMSQKDFKRGCAKMFSQLGFSVDMEPMEERNGADLLLEDEHGTKIAVLFILRKKQARNLSTDVVKKVVYGRQFYKADNALLIVNRPLTEGANKLALQSQVDIWDHEMVKEQELEGARQHRLRRESGAEDVVSEQESSVQPDELTAKVDLSGGELTPQEMAALNELLEIGEKIDTKRRMTKLENEYWVPYDASKGIPGEGNIGPYEWQVKFHNAGDDNQERCLIAANRIGKTHCGAAEAAIHAIGDYPDWWQGKRFTRANNGWCGGDTTETVRDIMQLALLGDVGGGELGTGWIPKEAIIDVKFRQAGIPDVVDAVRVRHKSGGISTIRFKTYEQGRKKWQGTSLDWCWLDEEPPLDVFTEALTRLLDRRGLMLLTYTPLNGASDVVMHFMDGGDGIFCINATWDDAPHLTTEDKKRMLNSYPQHERDTRAKGVPLAGSGVIYPVPDEDIICDPFPIPNHYMRICGIDFGMDHPFAAVWIAYDADEDVIYVYDCYKSKNHAAAYHATAIKRRGLWIPVSWPHDGMQRDKGSGKQLAKQFEDQGLNMLHLSARYKDKTGGAQPTEPIVQELDERMRSGRLRVFGHLTDWFREKRMYHRKDGQIVREHDDIMAATNYACMMKRFADRMVKQERPIQTQEYKPQDW